MPDKWRGLPVEWLGVGMTRETWERERDDGTTETVSVIHVMGETEGLWTAAVSVGRNTHAQAEEWLEEQRRGDMTNEQIVYSILRETTICGLCNVGPNSVSTIAGWRGYNIPPMQVNQAVAGLNQLAGVTVDYKDGSLQIIEGPDTL
jgi:acetyl-CoA acetyltransferase